MAAFRSSLKLSEVYAEIQLLSKHGLSLRRIAAELLSGTTSGQGGLG
jgi:hypothetical protein